MERLPDDELPPGTSRGFNFNQPVPGFKDDEPVLIVAPYYQGPPVFDTAIVLECNECQQKIWIAVDAPKDYRRVCTDCMDDLVPDWREMLK